MAKIHLLTDSVGKNFHSWPFFPLGKHLKHLAYSYTTLITSVIQEPSNNALSIVSNTCDQLLKGNV